MKKHVIDHFSLADTYESIENKDVLDPEEYVNVVIVIICALVKIRVSFSNKNGAHLYQNTSTNHVSIKKDLLDRALYFLDATYTTDENGHVTFPLRGVYYEQVMHLLYLLLQGKRVTFRPTLVNIQFYVHVYQSICDNLKVDQDLDFLDLVDVQRIPVKTPTKDVNLFAVLDHPNVVEVRLYSKYDNFDTDTCMNYRFTVTETNDPAKYPLKSFIFGTVQPDKRTVILYDDPECTLRSK